MEFEVEEVMSYVSVSQSVTKVGFSENSSILIHIPSGWSGFVRIYRVRVMHATAVGLLSRASTFSQPFTALTKILFVKQRTFQTVRKYFTLEVLGLSSL